MNYKGKKVAITGATGFLGRAIKRELEAAGAEIYDLRGDIKDPATFEVLDYSFSYLFHFAGPSSQILFKQRPFNSIHTAYMGFYHAAYAASKHDIKLIYPSTGLLSQDRENEYARSKKVWEDIHLGEHLYALGIRIFATYGPGEGHKRDYASVPYLFAREMVAGRSPVIFGDGNQVRDFIYVEDTAKAVIELAERCDEKIIDLGSGHQVSFNRIIEIINQCLGSKIKPEYIDRPAGYVDETTADITNLKRYYTPQVPIFEGIDLMIEELTRPKQ